MTIFKRQAKRRKATWARDGRKRGRGVMSFSVKGPADRMLSAYGDVSGTYLLEDGSVALVTDYVEDFDPEDYAEDDDRYEPSAYWKLVDRGVKPGDDLIVGKISVDTWNPYGLVEWDCIAYKEGMTLGEYFDENVGTGMRPVRTLPEAFGDAIRDGVPKKREFGEALDGYLNGTLDEAAVSRRLR